MTNFSNAAASGVVSADLLGGPAAPGVKPGTQFVPIRIDAVAALTALAAGGAAGATLLPRTMNEVTVAAAAGASVLLQANVVGSVQWVFNAGANSINVFAQPGETILGVNTGFAIAAGKGAMFACLDGTDWRTILSA